MSKEKHTPYRFDPEWFQIVDSENNVIADDVHVDKAELILKALNNHDRLVEALQDLYDWQHEVKRSKTYASVMDNAKQLLTELKS